MCVYEWVGNVSGSVLSSTHTCRLFFSDKIRVRYMPRGTVSMLTWFQYPRHNGCWKLERTWRTRAMWVILSLLGSKMERHNRQLYLLICFLAGSGGSLAAPNYNALQFFCRSCPFLLLLRWPWLVWVFFSTCVFQNMLCFLSLLYSKLNNLFSYFNNINCRLGNVVIMSFDIDRRCHLVDVPQFCMLWTRQPWF